MYSFFIYFFIKLANVFQKHPFFFFNHFQSSHSLKLPAPSARGSKVSPNDFALGCVCGVKKYDLPKSESVTEAEMEPRSGHCGVLLMVLISTFFSVAVPHSDLFCCVNVLKKKVEGGSLGCWKVCSKTLEVVFISLYRPRVKLVDAIPFTAALHWGYLSNCLTDSYTAGLFFLLCAAVLLFKISAAFCHNEWLNYNGATNLSELQTPWFLTQCLRI